MYGKGYMLCTEPPAEERNCLANYFRHIAPHPEEANTLVLYTYNKLMKYDTNLLWGFIKNNMPYVKKIIVFCPDITKTAQESISHLGPSIYECYGYNIETEVNIQPALF